MLKTRIITALAILPIVLIAMFAAPRWAWGLFTLVIVQLACWEWGRFCQFPPRGQVVYLAGSASFSALIFVAYTNAQLAGVSFGSFALTGFLVALVFWGVVAPLWLAKTWRPVANWIVASTGWVVIFPTWLALLQLRDISPWVLLSFAFIVWVADCFAYFVGKALGKHKLAPAISPGKTVEGVLGGLVGVLLYFWVWSTFAGRGAMDPNWPQSLLAQGWLLLVFFLILGVLSVVGDLFESWMKRGVGLKDSSSLLPGHGGILDRIDALTSTLPIAGLYMIMISRTQ